jgi:hypothetical protein
MPTRPAYLYDSNENRYGLSHEVLISLKAKNGATGEYEVDKLFTVDIGGRIRRHTKYDAKKEAAFTQMLNKKMMEFREQQKNKPQP